jgi:hypothetical protein
MWDHGPERRSGQDRRQGDRRHHERRQYQRRASGAEKPFFEVVPGRRKKADRRSGVDRRQGERRQWVRRHADVAALDCPRVLSALAASTLTASLCPSHEISSCQGGT